jgi:hypothetical protein
VRAETLHRNAVFHDPAHPQDGDTCAACVSDAAAYPPAPALRTEWHDGLEFEVPTWDPAPTPWLSSGSWVSEPETTARLLAAIRAALLDPDSLVEQALSRDVDAYKGEMCRTYWGSHGCDLGADHDGLHVCGERGDLCSAVLCWGGAGTAILWWADDEGGLRLSSHRWTWSS